MSLTAARRGRSRILFICALAAIFSTALLFAVNIIRWGNTPDFGFGYRTAAGFSVVGVVTGPGDEAGIEIGDRILKVNDRPFTAMKEFRAAQRRGLGDENRYLVERNGKQFEVVIRNTPLGFIGAFSRSGLTYLIGLCYVFIGIVVFLMKPYHRNSWIFFGFTVSIGLFFVFFVKLADMKPYWLGTVHILINTLVPAAFVHLALGFPEEKAIIKKHPWLQMLPYLAAIALFASIRIHTPLLADVPKYLYFCLIGYIALSIVFFLGSCLKLWLMSKSEIVRLRSKMILLGAGISALVPLFEIMINALFAWHIFPSFNYYLPFLVIFPLAIGYCIVKHDLFDIDAIIKRTYGYILTTTGIAGVYALFVFVSNLAFGRLEITKSSLFPLIFILAVVFFFNPIRNRVQKFIDKVFYRLEYDYQDTVQKISESMRTLLGLDQIGKSIMETALGTMFIDSGSVMLLNKDKQVYEHLIRAGQREKRKEPDEEERATGRRPEKGKEEIAKGVVLPASAPFVQKLAERMKEVTVYDVEEDPFFEDQKESCGTTMEEMEATLVVPLVYEEDLIGLIGLGGKKSGKFYRREDIRLLQTLANQGAVAIKNAWMVADVIEKERMEEELNIARDLQMSMLPASCPQVEGFEIAALSTPAREVGGDFFDFIEMGDDRVGLLVGDVTGKSVSGALVMSASRSVFRMLSEEKLGVDEIMIRANLRTKKDIKSGMFVALLYAVLDSKEKALRMCNAGQTQPVYFCSQRGEAKLLETEGDTFPLGIIEEADYKETKLLLAPGDKIVFYTDGIVEAMNEKQEMYGFERLLGLVRGSGSLDAESLLKEIMREVNEFVGGAPQSDDLTVIVVEVA